jgi:hypothetical protein
MTEAEWLVCTDPTAMLEYLRARTSDRKLRLIAVASCQRAKEFTEYWYHELADIAEAFAEGRATLAAMQAVRAKHHPSNDYFDRNAFYDSAGSNLGETIPHLVEDLAEWIATCHVDDAGKTLEAWETERSIEFERELAISADEVREIAGNPFRPVSIDSSWLVWNNGTVVQLAQVIHDERAFDRMPVLADALEDAGCSDAAILDHLRGPGPHVRGCWVVDLLLGKS